MSVHLTFQQLREFSGYSSSSSSSSDGEDPEETMHQEVDHQIPADSLAEPEFSGLWDDNYKVRYHNSHSKSQANPCKLLKLNTHKSCRNHSRHITFFCNSVYCLFLSRQISYLGHIV